MAQYVANTDLVEGGRRYKKGETVNLTEERAQELMAMKDFNGNALISEGTGMTSTTMTTEQSPAQSLSYNQPQTTNLQDQMDVMAADVEFAEAMEDDISAAGDMNQQMQAVQEQKEVDQYLSENPTATRAEAEAALGMSQVQGDPASAESQYMQSVADASLNAEFADEVAQPPKKSRAKK